MSLADLWKNAKNKFDSFLYKDEEGEEETTASEEEFIDFAPQPAQPNPQMQMNPQPYNQGYAPAYNAAYAPQQSAYQPQQSAYQPQQSGYQPQFKPAAAAEGQPMYSQFSAQMPQQRNRRVQQYQSQHAAQPAETGHVVPFPGTHAQEAPAVPSAERDSSVNVRLIVLRRINDCHSAISFLRNGDAVIVTMDQIPEQSEKRRYVDILSGACFSLSATITKVSQYGTYLIAPGKVRVLADAVISQMNNGVQTPASPQGNAPRTNPMYRPGTYQQPQPMQYAQAPVSDENGFVQSAPAPQMMQGNFYDRQPYAAPQSPSFESRNASGAGYVPDRMEEAE